MAGVSRLGKTFTAKQGQYLAYIHLYTRLHRRSPAETDMQKYFRVSPPSVHQMVLTLERAGFIRRQPETARSIELLVIPTSCRTYSDPGFNRSKSPCRPTSPDAWSPELFVCALHLAPKERDPDSGSPPNRVSFYPGRRRARGFFIVLREAPRGVLQMSLTNLRIAEGLSGRHEHLGQRPSAAQYSHAARLRHVDPG